MTLFPFRILAPVALLYGGAVLGGVLGAPASIIWVFAALFLAHFAVSGHPVFRDFDPAAPSCWAALAGLAAVQIALAALIWFCASAFGQMVGGAAPENGPLWPVLVSAGSLAWSWQTRRLNDPGFEAFLDDSVSTLDNLADALADQAARAEVDGARERTAEREILQDTFATLDSALPTLDTQARRNSLAALAGLSDEARVLDMLSARAEDTHWRLFRLDWLDRPEVTGQSLNLSQVCDILTDELTGADFRDRAAEVALRWQIDAGWGRYESMRLANAARYGTRSQAIAEMMAALDTPHAR